MVARILQAQQELFANAEASLVDRDTILSQRIAQFELRIGGLQQQVRAADRQLSLIREELTAVEELFRDGLATRSRLTALRREAAEIESRRGVAVASIAEVREGIQSAASERSLLMKEFSDLTGRELDEARQRINQLEGEIELAPPTRCSAPRSRHPSPVKWSICRC